MILRRTNEAPIYRPRQIFGYIKYKLFTKIKYLYVLYVFNCEELQPKQPRTNPNRPRIVAKIPRLYT
jgi:hypothetical protein